MDRKPPVVPEDLQDLAKLAAMPEWKTLCKMMKNRVDKDKNAIVSYPSDSPKLATQHAFMNGRISAVYAIKHEVENAANVLEKLEEKKEA